MVATALRRAIFLRTAPSRQTFEDVVEKPVMATTATTASTIDKTH
jgi:hypothetical protein